MTKNRAASLALWFAYGLALLASIEHVAWAFGTLQRPGSEGNGWLAACAVDLGLAALAYGIQQRKRAGRSARDLWVGVFFFAGISAFANFLYAVSSDARSVVLSGFLGTIDTLTLIRALVFSASLPLLVVYLGEIVSADDARTAQAAKEAAQKAQKTADRAETKTQRERIQAQARAEAELQAAELRAEEERQAQASAHVCGDCAQSFAKQQGLAAHKRYCKKGDAQDAD